MIKVFEQFIYKQGKFKQHLSKKTRRHSNENRR